MNTSHVKNIIAKVLGVFWVFDGLLQFQPHMFGADFVDSVLVPSLSGQPSFLHWIVASGIFLWNFNPALANTIAALLQIAIGVLFFFPPSSKKFRIGLWTSIVWGLIVWLCGEGAGMLFTGTASIYTGAPGSVLIYVLTSLLLLMGEKVQLTVFPKIAAWALIAGAVLQIQPSFWSSDGVQGSIMAASMEGVHVLATLPIYISNNLSINPTVGNWILVLLPFLIGLTLLIKPDRITGTITLVFLFLVWWLGQDFGMLTTIITGTSTDPNTAPLLGLLVIPLFL